MKTTGSTNYMHVGILLLLLTSLGMPLSAQNADATGQAANSIYAEVGGPGIVLSFNYDRRFGRRPDGLGGRIGFGGIALGETQILTVPVCLNYLAGSGNSYFEGGLGAVLYNANVDFLETSQTVFGVLNFGYRYQPRDGGLMFRAALTPVFGSIGGSGESANEFIFFPFFGGVAFGYAF